MTTLPRPEYPRPQFVRREWLNLNGSWEFDYDDRDLGLKEAWYVSNRAFTQQITVPFPFQSELSGINDPTFHDVVWYRRAFELPQGWENQRVRLHFGAVDYRATVWLNGEFVTEHEGGHTPFSAEINALPGVNYLVVRVEDRSTDLEQPRGKQFWKEQSESIFYTRTTGIWQTVWLEPVASAYLERVHMTPNIDDLALNLEYSVAHAEIGQELEIDIRYQGRVLTRETLWVQTVPYRAACIFTLPELHLWSPEQPNLYDITFRLKDGDRVLDEVESYFGMRKVSTEGGHFLLNNQPYYQKLVLDQGYFPESLLAAPNDEALRQDIELTKAMGFNGARKHQKVEDPRYLYWADQLGLLVWGEMANCHTFGDTAIQRITAEWQEAIDRDYNHPSIVVWVPLNESWGVPRLVTDKRQPNHANALVYLTRSLDPSRLVVSNDGWEHTVSDLCTIHDYTANEDIAQRYQTPARAVSSKPANRRIHLPGYTYRGEPIILSEFGGIAFKQSNWDGWGYSSAEDAAEFSRCYREVMDLVLSLPVINGYCYTQFCDVEQEINGLLTYDRRPKIDIELIRAINHGQVETVP